MYSSNELFQQSWEGFNTEVSAETVNHESFQAADDITIDCW